ncbi:hypothetical protein GRF59_15035 [Paenibacillus sp. HJL G12]|uniref:Uncharacterized protein n=1 Tax=Paenibacillus dendrobii TaxID=2691084 RepID=A0A7X3IJN6_9BACL|nr:hypothetical protein [Paenibacillus dendrobii]MWV44935.1 hypothetical protein [Paenibacillus dendrobii]
MEKLSKCRLVLFGIACFVFGVLDTQCVFQEGWHNSFPFLLFTLTFLVLTHTVCQVIEDKVG